MFQKKILPVISQNGYLNLTSSYRLDSDIPVPYLYTVKNKDKLPNGFFPHKTELIVWYVSHCKTDSKREDYILKLSKYLPIHIYGKCGNSTTCKDKRKDNCLFESLSKYKFYLSAENSICKEYFTGEF